MIDVICVKSCTYPKIKVEENGRCATILNPDGDTHNVVKVDGCAVKDGQRADFAIECNNSAVIIELKGRHVEHGAEQVFTTATKWMNDEKRCQRIAGLIVAQQFPRSSTRIQKKQSQFAKIFKGPLHISTCNREYYFESLLSFRGPLKK